MSDITKNLQLEKPIGGDFYNIGIYNANLDKIDGAIRWKHYTSFAETGVSIDQVIAADTLAILCEAMDDYSVLTVTPSAGSTWDSTWAHLLPHTSGTLVIRKISTNRTHLDFWAVSNTYTGSRYYATYHEGGGGDYVKKISPWVRVDSLWTQYTDLSQLGLTPQEVADSGTLATIVEAMASWSIATISVSDATVYKNLLPEAVGNLEIKRGVNVNRVSLEFANTSNSRNRQGLYRAVYRNDATEENGFVNKLSAWKRIATEDDIDELVAKVEETKKSVADGKTKVAKAISDKGQATAADATFDKMAENIGKIETGIKTDDATATAARILNGYTAYAKGVKITGNQILTPGMLKKGEKAFGITGTFEGFVLDDTDIYYRGNTSAIAGKISQSGNTANRYYTFQTDRITYTNMTYATGPADPVFLLCSQKINLTGYSKVRLSYRKLKASTQSMGTLRLYVGDVNSSTSDSISASVDLAAIGLNEMNLDLDISNISTSKYIYISHTKATFETSDTGEYFDIYRWNLIV